VFDAVRSALAASSHTHFRLLQFSVQADHLHLLVEADRADGLARGCQGLAVRVAKAVNRVLGRRGSVWGDRYHARRLTTPREMRAALVYVLQNWLKHVRGARGCDPRSSAGWFNEWRTPPTRPQGLPPVRAARTWLARVGWLRHGRIDADEGPRVMSGQDPPRRACTEARSTTANRVPLAPNRPREVQTSYGVTGPGRYLDADSSRGKIRLRVVARRQARPFESGREDGRLRGVRGDGSDTLSRQEELRLTACCRDASCGTPRTARLSALS
jgi:putative transposase